MPEKQIAPCRTQWAFVSVAPLGMGLCSLRKDSRANPALEPSVSSLMWFCTAPTPVSSLTLSGPILAWKIEVMIYMS